MKKTTLTLILLGSFAASLPLHAAQLNSTATLTDTQATTSITVPSTQFTTVINDLPLMPGLSLVPEEDVLFVAPNQGRIAETTAAGAVDIDDVYKYYRRNLPHLGWTIVDGRTYARENELLRIDAHADGKVTTVRFTVKPKK